jgi:recombination protein RecA
MSDLASLETISGNINTKYGKKTCTPGVASVKDPYRLPTGIFAMTYASGGGFPVGQISVIKGPEHGGKTSTAMSTMSMVPKMCWRCFNTLSSCTCSLPSIKMKTVWIDAEGRFNRFWAESIGCNPDDYYLLHPEDGNQAGDQAKQVLSSDDCGLVVIDSMAALVPSEMIGASFDDKFIANQAKLISAIVSRITNKLLTEENRDHPCLVLLINQMRANIGVFYGPNTIMAGGYALRYFNGLNINIAKKALQDKDKYYSKEKDLFLAQKHAFSVDKYSSLKLAESGEFIRITADIPELGYNRGDIVDHRIVFTKAVEHELIIKKGTTSSYTFEDKTKTQKEFIELWKQDKNVYLNVQVALLNKIRNGLFNKEKSNDIGDVCPPEGVKPAKKK